MLRVEMGPYIYGYDELYFGNRGFPRIEIFRISQCGLNQGLPTIWELGWKVLS